MTQIPATMNAVMIDGPGPAEVLRLVQRPVPQPAPGELLIRVSAAGLNRGDIVQRQGGYPPPPGISDLPGLEVSGTIAALGEGVLGWQVGDRVCALIAGGGYAGYAVAPALQCLRLPADWSMAEGAGLPETLFTCWANVIEDGRLEAGQTLLIHGGASGIGTMGTALARAIGARVFVTAGTDAKCAACRDLGAELAINYKTQDFVPAVLEATGGAGVDVVLDMVGADYVGRSMQALAFGGRYVLIGIMKGVDAQINAGLLVGKRLTLTGSTLRSRSPAEKGRIRDAIRDRLWDDIAARRIVPVIGATFPLARAADAHRALESGAHVGKIVLTTE